MTISLSQLKTGARAAIVAASLAVSVCAMPTAALAASPHIDFDWEADPSFSVGISGGGLTFGIGGPRCMSRDRIRREFRQNDFENIDIVRFRTNSARTVVEATWEENDEDYEVTFNRCNGDVYEIDQIS
jgi:hypothetical protein